ncbi:hypothetical protein BY996DRAFT_6616213 [Phakopsora pachyrhizi]|nr:hypothetical protein BY996DRAFT_6616213 [Phakopsora pachyrhizi]
MFYINQLTILSEATLLGDLSLNVVHTAEAEPHELLLTRNSLKKSKSLPNLNLDKFPLEIKSEPLSDVSVPELAECPKTENEGTKIDSFRSEEQENVHEGGIVENNKAKLKKVAFEQLQDAEPSRSSHSSQSHQPVNLQTSYESHLHSPPIPNSYHPGSAFANSQEAQVFPGFTYPLGSEEFTSPSPYLVYAHPGVLYSLVKGKPKEIVPSATTTNNIPIIHSAVQQFEHLAPSYVSPEVFYGPQSQPYHSESPLMQTIGGHPAAYPSGYSTQGYGYQTNMFLRPSKAQDYTAIILVTTQEFQYHPIDSNSYKAVNLHPPRYQGISSSAAHPHRHVSKKWRTRSPPMVLDKEKNLERVAVNKPDLENFSKSSSNVEISSSSSIESEFDSQKEADKAEDHQKPEVKQSSQGGLYLPRYSRKKKPIKNSFYGYESSRQNGWKSHYKITKNLGFKTKYIPKNKHLDKKDELMLNDIHYENQNNGSKDDKISKLTTDYDSEKTLKLKEILGLENRQVSKESKDLLEDENTFINNSEGKRRKNTFITSLEDLKGNSEKADFLKNRISLKDDIKKTNIDSTDDSSHLQAHHNAGETSTNKMKQSDPQGTLEKNREPSTESKELFNKKSKEDEKIQIESTSTSDDKILPMMADSQLDPTKNQKTEHDMNQEKNFNRQDQKLAEEGEKKIEVSLSQKPELIISSNEDFPLLAEAIKTNKKNMLIEGEKKLKANKIYGAESSRNSALRNNYKNIKNSGVNAKDLSNEKVLDNKKELILNHNHSKNKIKYIQGDYVLEPPMDYNSKKRFKLEEILGAENTQVPKKSEKKIEAEKNVINKSEGIQKDILSFPVEVQVENSEEASLVQNKLFVKNNKKNSIDPRKDFSLFQDKQNKREKNAEKSAIQEILQKGNKPIPNVGNILNLYV